MRNKFRIFNESQTSSRLKVGYTSLGWEFFIPNCFSRSSAHKTEEFIKIDNIQAEIFTKVYEKYVDIHKKNTKVHEIADILQNKSKLSYSQPGDLGIIMFVCFFCSFKCKVCQNPLNIRGENNENVWDICLFRPRKGLFSIKLHTSSGLKLGSTTHRHEFLVFLWPYGYSAHENVRFLNVLYVFTEKITNMYGKSSILDQKTLRRNPKNTCHWLFWQEILIREFQSFGIWN